MPVTGLSPFFLPIVPDMQFGGICKIEMQKNDVKMR